jgi:hypothetical protein
MAKSKNELKQRRPSLRYDLAEEAAFTLAARIAGLTMAAWMRTRLRVAAKRELEEAGRDVPFDQKGKT